VPVLTTADPSKSTVSGIPSTIEAFTENTIVVQAKDSAGVNLTTGGDFFRVEVRNKCIIAKYGNWVEDSTAKQSLQSSFNGTMVDHSNGTYTYSFTVEQSGEISIIVQGLGNGVYAEYYRTINLSGNVALTRVLPNIYLTFGSNDIPGQPDHWTAKFTTLIKPNYSGTFTIYILMDDGSSFYWDGVVKIERFNQPTTSNDFYTFTVAVAAGEFYLLEVCYRQVTGPKYLRLSWSGPSTPTQPIPNSAYYYYQYIGSQPHQVVVNCPRGYYGDITSSPYRCKEICADGIRAGDEECDDGNTDNKDGCDSSCQVETIIWQCSLGINSPDTWTYWGDGVVAGDEECDDKNYKSGDGWSFSGWKKETDFIYNYYRSPDNKKDIFTYWGDGIRYGTEEWDDANTSNGDGCTHECKVEEKWKWLYGSVSSRDYW
jgi:cysteine-rich repeat protein